MKNTKAKINVIKKLIASGLLCTTAFTVPHNFKYGTGFTAFAQDPAEKRVLERDDVQKLMQDSSVVSEGPNGKVFKIPEGITEIGREAFRNCDSLAEIIIPDSVTKIGPYAFSYCYHLTNITIPNSVTEIGEMTFAYCRSLTKITIPDNVEKIGLCAFTANFNLTQINIPNSVKQIGPWAFYGCSSLTKITIPNSVTEINRGAFAGCSSLNKIIIPDSVTKIGAEVFSGCTSLTQIILPKSIKEIPHAFFFSCTDLNYIVPFNEDKPSETEKSSMNSGFAIVPANANKFEPYCFVKCSNLKSIELLGEEISLEKNCFDNCDSLKLTSFPNAKKLEVRSFNNSIGHDEEVSIFVPANCNVTLGEK